MHQRGSTQDITIHLQERISRDDRALHIHFIGVSASSGISNSCLPGTRKTGHRIRLYLNIADIRTGEWESFLLIPNLSEACRASAKDEASASDKLFSHNYKRLTMDVARCIEVSVRLSITLIWKLSPMFPITGGAGKEPLARTALSVPHKT